MILAAGAAPEFLVQVAAIVVTAAAVAWVCQRLALVPIVGFLLAGMAVGLHALGLVDPEQTVHAAAEIGAILLLFVIGIEFNLGRLARERHRPIEADQLAEFGTDGRLTATDAADQREPSELLRFSGLPIRAPIVHHGPLVMSTREEFHQAIDDFRAGRLGTIPADELAPRDFA